MSRKVVNKSKRKTKGRKLVYKAVPGYGAVNHIRRAQDRTFEEWRIIFDPVFQKVRNDIGKNLQMWEKEDKDIDQRLEELFVVYYHRFMEGDDRYEFPPTGGAFYQNGWWEITKLFVFNALEKEYTVHSTPHDSLIWSLNQVTVDFHEEREKRISDDRDYNLYLYMEQYLDISMDGALGPEFALWWMGYTYPEIASMFMSADIKGYTWSTLKRKMGLAFQEINEKYLIDRQTLKDLRKKSQQIKRNQGVL